MASKQPEHLPVDSSSSKTKNITDESHNSSTGPEAIVEESIRCWCPECGQKYRFPTEMAGKTAVCLRCHNYMLIPEESQTKPPLKLTIVFACKHCGKKIRKPGTQSGTEVKCAQCGGKNIVPQKSQISALPKKGAPPQERIVCWCEYCGQKYNLAPQLAGKNVSCDRCLNTFVVPHKAQDKIKIRRTVVFPCKYCGRKQWRDTSLIGQEVECRKCGKEIEVPGDLSLSPLFETANTDSERILVWCTHCNQKYRLPKSFSGKKATCDRCQNTFIIPEESQTQPPPAKQIIMFQCENCGRHMSKPRNRAGRSYVCRKCGYQGIIPKESKKSLLEMVSPKNLLKSLVSPKTSGKDDRIAGKKNKQIPALPKLKKSVPDSDSTAEDAENELPVITFYCKYCAKKLVEPKTRAGKQTNCSGCGRTTPIPRHPKRTAQIKLSEQSIVSAADGKEPPLVGQIPPSEMSPTSSPAAESYAGLQIIVTENPPLIHRAKNYFQQKAEKYFIFAMIAIFVDYLIDSFNEGYHPSKAFVFFLTFIVAVIIAASTWKYITYDPPDTTSKCRYNVKCTNPECDFAGIRRYLDVNKQSCPKCSSLLGLLYRCNNCGKTFALNEEEYRRQNLEKLKKDSGGDKDVRPNIFNSHVVKKCPYCDSENVKYITVKEAREEAKKLSENKQKEKTKEKTKKN